MNRKLRVGVLGLTHDHLWDNLKELGGSPQGELTAAADPNGPLREKIQKEYGCPQVFSDFDEMLDKVKLDAVYVYSSNRAAPELTAMAAKRGIAVMAEKPMAADLAGADRMMAVCRENGVPLMINWPLAWWPALQHAFTLARSGEIGRITGTRYRAAHSGPKEIGCSRYFYGWLYDQDENGAGALMDYCCYGAALARYLLGQPSRVTGVKGRLAKDYILMEDNAVIVMQWPSAICITEASWTQIGKLSAYGFTIYGAEGTLVAESGPTGRLLLATREKPDGVEVKPPKQQEEQSSATAYFLSRVAGDGPVEGLCSAEVGRDAQEILEAGLISALEGYAVSLPLPVEAEGRG
jgi:predicted dehydrogenase